MVMQDAIRALIEAGAIEPAMAAGALEEIMTGAATPAQIGAFLAALRVRGETPEVIAACMEVTQRHCEPVPARERHRHRAAPAATAPTPSTSRPPSAFVVAGAGVRVAKHGNRAASSRCGQRRYPRSARRPAGPDAESKQPT